MQVVDFVEGVYLHEIKARRRPSTLKNYKDIFRIHLKPRLGETSLRQFRCCDGERRLGDIARQAKTKDGKPLGRNTLSRIKSFLSGTFKTAKRLGALDGVNPMTDTSLQGGAPPGVTDAYSLPEIKSMLAVLPEPAKTAVLVAAFTELRHGQIRGLLRKTFNGNTPPVAPSLLN